MNVEIEGEGHGNRQCSWASVGMPVDIGNEDDQMQVGTVTGTCHDLKRTRSVDEMGSGGTDGASTEGEANNGSTPGRYDIRVDASSDGDMMGDVDWDAACDGKLIPGTGLTLGRQRGSVLNISGLNNHEFTMASAAVMAALRCAAPFIVSHYLAHAGEAWVVGGVFNAESPTVD